MSFSLLYIVYHARRLRCWGSESVHTCKKHICFCELHFLLTFIILHLEDLKVRSWKEISTSDINWIAASSSQYSETLISFLKQALIHVDSLRENYAISILGLTVTVTGLIWHFHWESVWRLGDKRRVMVAWESGALQTNANSNASSYTHFHVTPALLGFSATQAIVIPPISESLKRRRKVPLGFDISMSWACCLFTKPKMALKKRQDMQRRREMKIVMRLVYWREQVRALRLPWKIMKMNHCLSYQSDKIGTRKHTLSQNMQSSCRFEKIEAVL